MNNIELRITVGFDGCNHMQVIPALGKLIKELKEAGLIEVFTFEAQSKDNPNQKAEIAGVL